MPFRSFKVPVKYLLPFIAITLFVVQLGLALSDLPSIKMMQDIICKRHYGITSDERFREDACRIEPIQQELNIISMGILISVTIACALVASPFCILADKIGRVPVLGMSILGMLLSQGYAMYVCFRWKTISLRAIWAIGAPLLLGGGRSVAEAMVFTIISDIVPDTKRAIWFQWVVGAVLLAQLLAPIISGSLVQISLWLPLFLSLGLVSGAGLTLVLLTPETLQAKKAKEAFSLDPTTENASTPKGIRFLLAKPTLLLLLPGTVLVIPVASVQSDLLLRLMPICFMWSLNKSALLISLRSLVTLVTLFIVLPGITWLCCRKSNSSSFRRDATLARMSAVFFVFGSLFLMMISSEVLVILGIIVSALGSGLPTLCRAMLVSLVEKEKTGSIFGILAVGEILGFLVCELGMGSLFGVGLKTWLGLPFGLGAVLALGVGIATWCVPVQQRKNPDEFLTHED